MMAAASTAEAMNRVLNSAPVIPVLTIEDASVVEPLVTALVEGGLGAVEITLRTPSALAAIRAASRIEPAIIGAGTVRTAEQVRAAAGEGAKFLVSPGATDALLDAVERVEIPFLPGAETISETMRLTERDYWRQKFFPADSAGGIGFLQSVRAVLPEVRFCPTGGITEANAGEYLAEPNVACVGGSWVAPASMIEDRNWKGIRNRAERAANFARSSRA